MPDFVSTQTFGTALGPATGDQSPRCEHCGLKMPSGATFGPGEWMPWQPGGPETFTQFCPDHDVEHNPIRGAAASRVYATWQTMLNLTKEQ